MDHVIFAKKLQVTLDRAIECIQQLEDEDMTWKPNPQSNSIAQLSTHMAENLLFFLSHVILKGDVDFSQFQKSDL
jgi:hypothetical protein